MSWPGGMALPSALHISAAERDGRGKSGIRRPPSLPKLASLVSAFVRASASHFFINLRAGGVAPASGADISSGLKVSTGTDPTFSRVPCAASVASCASFARPPASWAVATPRERRAFEGAASALVSRRQPGRLSAWARPCSHPPRPWEC